MVFFTIMCLYFAHRTPLYMDGLQLYTLLPYCKAVKCNCMLFTTM